MSLESLLLGLAGLTVGVVVGALTTFGVFSGRVSTLEANYAALSKTVDRLEKSIDSNLSELTEAISTRIMPMRPYQPSPAGDGRGGAV